MSAEEKARIQEAVAKAEKECRGDPECLARLHRMVEQITQPRPAPPASQTRMDEPQALTLGAIPAAAPLCDKPVPAATVRKILDAWLGKLESGLPGDLRRQIDTEMAGYPQNMPAGAMPISLAECTKTRTCVISNRNFNGGIGVTSGKG